MNAPAQPLSHDVRTIGLVGLAHGISHFFHLLLPPLFPLLIAEFGYSYSQLGLLLSVFFITSGLGQTLSGFAVDRWGARPVLFTALACFVAAGLVAGVAQGYGGLVAAALLAGLGNAPFHPVDFTILNHRVSPQRLGHGFAVHGISGNLGWAFAPVYLMAIVTATGSWRMACLGASALAMVGTALLWWQRDALSDGRRYSRQKPQGAPTAQTAEARSAAQAEPAAHPLAFLKLPDLWLCFSFFFWSTCSLSAIQSFAGPALHRLYGLPESLTAMVVTGYMVCGAAGMVVGGFLVARVERLEKTIACCLLGSAALLVLVGLGWPAASMAFAIAALAGAGIGIAGPSRDMLIKRTTPPGATGRVYGTVYAGLDVGFAVAAPVFGALLDRGWNAAVFYGSALALVLGVASAALVGLSLAARSRQAMA